MDSSSGKHQLEYKGYMKGITNKSLISIGHNGWVTSMQVGEVTEGDQTREFLISGARDKSIMIWDI